MLALALFAMLMAVLVGILGLGSLAQFARGRDSTEALWSYRTFLVFNVLLIGGIAFRYFEYHLAGSFSPEGYQLVQLLLLNLLIPLKLMFLFCLEETGTHLADRQSVPAIVRWARVVVLVFGSTVLVGSLVLFATGAPAIAFESQGWFEFGVAGALLLIAVSQIFSAFTRTLVAFRKRALLYFSGLHTASFFLMITVLLVSFRLPDRVDVLLSSNVMFLYNVLFILWGRRFLPLFSSSSAASYSNRHLIQEFGITPREIEVIDLISKGMTNQEIANALYISVETVKDHNHNIFRKTGVTNRVQLTNLFRRPSALQAKDRSSQV